MTDEPKIAAAITLSPPQYSDAAQPGQNVAQDAQFAQVDSQAQSVGAIAQNYRDQLYARCAMGDHQRKTEYGLCGIITGAACFPLGLIFLFLDTKEKCERCGVLLEKKKKLCLTR